MRVVCWELRVFVLVLVVLDICFLVFEVSPFWKSHNGERGGSKETPAFVGVSWWGGAPSPDSERPAAPGQSTTSSQLEHRCSWYTTIPTFSFVAPGFFFFFFFLYHTFRVNTLHPDLVLMGYQSSPDPGCVLLGPEYQVPEAFHRLFQTDNYPLVVTFSS